MGNVANKNVATLNIWVVSLADRKPFAINIIILIQENSQLGLK